MEEYSSKIINWNEKFLLPNEFSQLFKVEKKYKMTLSDIIRHVNKYIRNNGLQDIENGYKINPDLNLKKLLKLHEHDNLTYFTLIDFVRRYFFNNKLN
tara:strand:+ start:1881 stop:2174 length:294 start_codon:yes stop_codon:yes gene_type:complete